MLPAYLQGQAFQHTDFRELTCKVTCVPSWFPALGKGTSFCLTNTPLNLLDNIAPKVLLMIQQRELQRINIHLAAKEGWVGWFCNKCSWRHQYDTPIVSQLALLVIINCEASQEMAAPTICQAFSDSIHWLTTKLLWMTPSQKEASSICNEVPSWLRSSPVCTNLQGTSDWQMLSLSVTLWATLSSYRWRRSEQGYNQAKTMLRLELADAQDPGGFSWPV